MTAVYTSDSHEAAVDYRDRGSAKRPIDAAKDAVPVIDLADRLCGPGGLRRVGKEWVGRCPLPDHEDRSPSFTTNPERNVFFCHGCARGGSVIDLAMLAWQIPEPKAAACEVLLAFGYEIPARPASWHGKQERQKTAREKYEAGRLGITQRRVYKLFRAEQEAIGGPQPDEGDRELMWVWAGIVARALLGARDARANAGSAA